MEAEAAMALPNDLLADVLGRLPARSLAASRRVCKAWRDLVDEQRLLLRLGRLLPHSLRGLFINYQDYKRPHFFARPRRGPHRRQVRLHRASAKGAQQLVRGHGSLQRPRPLLGQRRGGAVRVQPHDAAVDAPAAAAAMLPQPVLLAPVPPRVPRVRPRRVAGALQGAAGARPRRAE